MSNPLVAEQCRDLPYTVAVAKPEVRIEYVERLPVNIDLHPDRAARFADRGKSRSPYQARGQCRKNGVAIAFFLDMQCRVKVGVHL